MNVHCHAWLGVCANEEDCNNAGMDIFASYHLKPDSDGIERAKSIISSRKGEQ